MWKGFGLGGFKSRETLRCRALRACGALNPEPHVAFRIHASIFIVQLESVVKL